MRLEDVINDFIRHIKHEAGYTQATCTSYQANLRHFLRWLQDSGYAEPDLATFATPILRRYLYAESNKGKRPRSIRGLFAPLKALAKFLLAQDAIQSDPVASITMPKKDAPHRPVTSDEECTGLLATCERLRSPRRIAMARALLGAMIWCGLRASEVLALKLADLSMERRTLGIVQGKG